VKKLLLPMKMVLAAQEADTGCRQGAQEVHALLKGDANSNSEDREIYIRWLNEHAAAPVPRCEQALDKAEQLSTKSRQAGHLVFARRDFRAGEALREAERTVQKVLASDPEKCGALIIWDTCWPTERETRRSVGYIKRAVDLDPTTRVFDSLGWAYSDWASMNWRKTIC